MALDPRVSFTRQLRAGTADLHASIETVSELPESVHTIHDYAVLLSTFHAAHARIEGALASEELTPGWLELGIDLAHHCRLGALTEDLRALGTQPEDATGAGLVLRSPAEALGCLYVIEGSALGRRVLAPLVKERLGDVPSAFFDGTGSHPGAWRNVQRALQSSTGNTVRERAITGGARVGFEVFLNVFRRRAAHQQVSCR